MNGGVELARPVAVLLLVLLLLRGASAQTAGASQQAAGSAAAGEADLASNYVPVIGMPDQGRLR